MFSRAVLAPTLLAASVGVPYAVTNSADVDWSALSGSTVASYFTTDAGKASETATSSVTLPGIPGTLPMLTPQGSEAAVYPVVSPLEGNPTTSLAEVLRMDVSKEWVYSRWPRKSTGLANLNDFGVRVPLVSGTRITDLAGSLTYRFDAYGHVQRISFRGRTGDTTELVTLLVQKYQLRRQPTTIPGNQLYQVRRGNEVISELRTQPAAVLWSGSPHASFDVVLELQRPGGPPLPPQPLLEPVEDEQQASSTQPAQSAQPEANATETASNGNAKTPVNPQAQWQKFFPRSQVPPGQLEHLQRSRM